jgi:HlyD family secretion protein
VIVGAAVALALIGIFVVRPLLWPGISIHYVTRPVGYADIAATVSETGIVNPVTRVMVGSEVSGTVRALTADFNSRVRKGQVLANLDPTTYQAAVDSAHANLSLPQASADSTVMNVDKMKAELDLANLLVLVVRGQLHQAQYNLSKTVILSPFDGIVMARNVSIGQTVAASLQTPTLFTIATNLTDMQVDTSVDEADVGSLREK